MAMTFTLVSHLREQLSSLVRLRAEKRKQDEQEKERLALEVLLTSGRVQHIFDIFGISG